MPSSSYCWSCRFTLLFIGQKRPSFCEAIIAVDLFKDFGKGFKFTNIKGKEVELITSLLLIRFKSISSLSAQVASRNMASSTSGTSGSLSTRCSRPHSVRETVLSASFGRS